MQNIINLKKVPRPQIFKKKRFLSLKILILLVIVLILIIFIIYFLQESTTVTVEEAELKAISIEELDSDKYWAVFLTNNQVYFGIIKSILAI